MFAASLHGLLSVLTFHALGMLILGVLWGLAISFMPGVGGIVAMVLLLPFIFGMDFPSAMALLLGAHTATIFGSSITSILLNVPGASKSVVLCWDGYPLTLKGEAVRALGASAMASLIGGIVGVVFLTAALPLLRDLIDVIGPAEIFLLAIWGLTIIAVLSEGSLLKGLIAAGVGLMFSFVGESAITGTPRFTFGALFLQDGIQFPVAAMGLFTISQMIKLFVHGSPRSRDDRDGQREASNTGMLWQGIKDVFVHWRMELHLSLFGVLAGIIPGLGAPVAAVAAYGQAVQTSKHPERFGQGAIEGIIAPQATDAASEGSGILPLVALGIPAHEQQAVLISAFVVLGVAPGVTMLTKHLTSVFAIIWVILLAYIVVTAIGLLAARRLSRLATLPSNVLVPAVMTVAVVGAYAIRGSIYDVVVVVAFGIIGYFMERYQYSRADLVIGFVLGPIIENYFHISTSLYGPLVFITRPSDIGISALILATAAWTFWRKRAPSDSGDVTVTGG